MSGLGFIAPEKHQQCDGCGEVAELRPYGPNGSKVCHPCAMKDLEQTEARYRAYVEGVPLPEKYR